MDPNGSKGISEFLGGWNRDKLANTFGDTNEKATARRTFFTFFPTSRVRRSCLKYSALKLPLLAHATWPRSYPCRCLWYGTKYNGGRTQWPDTTWCNDRNLHATCQACRHSSLCQCNTCKVFNREHFHHHPIPSNFITSFPIIPSLQSAAPPAVFGGINVKFGHAS